MNTNARKTTAAKIPPTKIPSGPRRPGLGLCGGIAARRRSRFSHAPALETALDLANGYATRCAAAQQVGSFQGFCRRAWTAFATRSFDPKLTSRVRKLIEKLVEGDRVVAHA